MLRKSDEVSVVAKTYDFVLWLLPHLVKFPRDHRFTLGNRLEDGVLEILDQLVEATYTREKHPLLRRANVRLERLRYLIRLSKDLKLLSLGQYEFAARAMENIGAEIGGWEKQQGGKQCV
ncbi:MAG: hypothetical protein AUJ92_08420 [Armatimonadetes bacterium CG2_30_59_28]|nr:MAG: hypothetical protein AUJ92_08420 [Armatimonadetes bacterium CG2_30_59_28]PIU66329.1 MAG: four helix bundle protein [Armatimonadetes bacterium CG07_land_8_20_14_0_80_59_28]PIX40209.1 MAG: four helix bundle protein [Armatimonadetes bacterium CG_4_8_14_3_um_filter_58_9]